MRIYTEIVGSGFIGRASFGPAPLVVWEAGRPATGREPHGVTFSPLLSCLRSVLLLSGLVPEWAAIMKQVGPYGRENLKPRTRFLLSLQAMSWLAKLQQKIDGWTQSGRPPSKQE